jgi:hypothetical protein
MVNIANFNCGVYEILNYSWLVWIFLKKFYLCIVDYHLITLFFRHLTNCMIYMLKLPHAHILVCNDLIVLSHGCIHLGGVSCINHGIKLILLLIVENSNWL